MSNRLKENMMNTKKPLYGAAIAIAIGVLAQPAVADAKDNEWDIQAYDSCVAVADSRYLSGQIGVKQYHEERRFCCERSGGQWVGDHNSHATGTCTAPPATAQTAPQSPGEVVQAPSSGTAGGGQTPSEPGGTWQVVPTGPGGGGLYIP